MEEKYLQKQQEYTFTVPRAEGQKVYHFGARRFKLLAGAVLAAWSQPEAMSSPAWLLMLFVVAATVGFLLLNWPPAKIFMGDVGSTWLAFMVFALALRCHCHVDYPHATRGTLVRGAPQPCLPAFVSALAGGS